jgi:hypothetical protein
VVLVQLYYQHHHHQQQVVELQVVELQAAADQPQREETS